VSNIRTKTSGRQNEAPVPQSLNDVILSAVANIGYNGRGKGGVAGYFQALGQRYPKMFFRLIFRMLDNDCRLEDAAAAQAVKWDSDKLDRLVLANRTVTANELLSCRVESKFQKRVV
jgi:hypothetical protein